MIRLTKFNVQVVKESSKSYNFDGKKINEPQVAFEMIEAVLKLSTATQEIFGMLTMDAQKNVTGIFEITKGILNSSLVHTREVFQRAILQNADSILIFHNHPSGDTKPSRADISVTNMLVDASKIIGISIIDHIIIGDETYRSLSTEGYL